MPRKKAAQRRGLPNNRQSPEQWESTFLSMMKAHKEDPRRAPWDQNVKPWNMVLTHAREIQAALILAPGDSALTAALVAAIDIGKLEDQREADNRNIDQAARQQLNQELGVRWAAFVEQLEDLSQAHDLPFYKALTASKEQRDTPNNKSNSNS
jgi:hypothetical protein